MKLLVVFAILISITSCGIIAEKINNTQADEALSESQTWTTLSEEENEIFQQLENIVDRIENISYNLFSVDIENIDKYLYSENNNETDFYTNSEFWEHIVMVPWLGLSHSIYLNTPDKRKSFFEIFTENGFLVSVMNPATNIWTMTEQTKTWNPDKIWNRWGFWFEKDYPYENTQFPVEKIDEFYKQFPNYWSETVVPENVVLKNYLEDTEGAYIMFHSAAWEWVFDFAKNNPDLVKWLIAIEPVWCPQELDTTPNQKLLVLYGDYVESRNQTGRYNACVQTYQFSKQHGNTQSQFIDLPSMWINGNSHLLMQDKNNWDIAEKIIDWIQK